MSGADADRGFRRCAGPSVRVDSLGGLTKPCTRRVSLHMPAQISRRNPGVGIPRIGTVVDQTEYPSTAADAPQITCYTPGSVVDPWCSGPTCQPVTLEIAGSNPVGSAIFASTHAPSARPDGASL